MRVLGGVRSRRYLGQEGVVDYFSFFLVLARPRLFGCFTGSFKDCKGPSQSLDRENHNVKLQVGRFIGHGKGLDGGCY